MNIEYICLCGWLSETEPEESRCPRCRDLVGAVANETEELPPGQRAEWVFGPSRSQAAVEAIVRKVMTYLFQPKRLMFTPPGERHPKRTKTGRRIMVALREYAELNQIPTRGPGSHHWKKKATALLAGDMISVVLPQLPRIRFDGDSHDLDDASLEHWAHELRRLVDREGAEQLLGTDGGKEPPVPDAAHLTDTELAILRMVELEFALQSARRRGLLDEEDERAIHAMKLANAVERDAAQLLGWSGEKLRKRLQRIREKVAEHVA
jgi:hypothetical protein